MSTRNAAARTVRQRKLNPKQGLRIIRESEIEEQLDDESQRQVYHGETGVEKAEEIVCVPNTDLPSLLADSRIGIPSASRHQCFKCHRARREGDAELYPHSRCCASNGRQVW